MVTVMPVMMPVTVAVTVMMYALWLLQSLNIPTGINPLNKYL